MSPLTISLSETEIISGFIYTPVEKMDYKGNIYTYSLDVSIDGKSWNSALKNKEFSNIQNNPIAQYIKLDNPIKARYIKLKPLTTVGNVPSFVISDFALIVD